VAGSSSPSSRIASAGLLLALVPVIVLPQLIGGVHPEVAAGFAVVELVALSLWWGARASAGHRLRASWLALPFIVGVVLTALQVVPLPEGLLQLLQADAAALRRFVADGLPEALRSGVESVTSLDPAETRAALLRLVGAAALCLVVGDAAFEQRRARLVWRVVLVGAALLFLSAVVHALLQAPGAWGHFTRHGGVLFAPIVNPNHLAKVFGGFACAALGRAFSAHTRSEALVAGAVFIGCGAGVGLTLSRGGIVAFVVALLVWAALLWRTGRLEKTDDDAAEPKSRLVLPSLGLSAILVVITGVVVIGDDAVIDEVASVGDELGSNRERSKLMLIAPALSLLESHGLVGVGNNAFGVAFTRPSARGQMVDDEVYFSHPENVVVAVLVEHGLIGGGALLLLCLVLAVHLLRAARTRRLMAAVPALAMLLIGDLVDFALETGAGIALMAVCLGLASIALPARRRISRSLAFVVVAAGAVLVAAAAPGAIRAGRLQVDRDVAQAPLSRRTDALHQAIAARPFDAILAAQLAVDARQRHQPREALAWANRAINLWPTLTPAHLEAARALAAMGKLEQAMLSYREASGGRSRLSRQALTEAFARTPDIDLRRRALVDTAAANASLCRQLEQERRLTEALACADDVAARPDATDVQRLEPLRLAAAGDDVAALRRRIENALQGGPPDGPTAATVARALVRAEGPDAALATTSTWTSLRDPRALLEWRLQALATAGRFDDALQVLAALRPLATSPAERDRHDRSEADLCAQMGNHGQRVLVLQRLVLRHPEDAELLATLGLAEHAAGRSTAAHQTLRRVREAGRSPPSLPALERALGVAREPR
jgi:tetratricopeptide (TPR) repeat protein